MRFCPKCGCEVKDDDSFCGQCGCDLRPFQGSKTENMNERPIITVEVRPRPAVNWPVVIMVAALLVAASIGGVYILTKDPFIGHDETVSFTWEADGKSYSYTLTIEAKDINTLNNSKIERGGTVSSDQYRFKDSGKVVYGVKDYIVVDGYIDAMVHDLRGYYDDTYKDNPDAPEFAQFLSWFVQNAIDYAEDNGEYWKYPLETLRDKKGDCEDGAMLLAAMLDAAGYDAGIYLLPYHAMAAISVESVEKEYANERFGYYPIETAFTIHTTNEDIGWVLEMYEEVYFHLYTGYSNEYV